MIESSVVSKQRSKWHYVGLLGALAIVAVAAGWLVGSLVPDGPSIETVASTTDGARTFTYRIPNGTAERITRGQEVNILPSELHVRVGDTIVIHNDDALGQTIGPFYVESGTTVRQTFSSPTVYTGLCTLHTNKTIKIVVAQGDIVEEER